MNKIVVGLFVIAACGAEHRETVAPIAQTTSPSAVLEYKRSLELDYRLPMNASFTSPRSDFVESVPLHAKLFAKECLAGDRLACIRALSYSIVGTDDAFEQHVAPHIQANCRAGHDLSCRSMIYRDLAHNSPPDLSDEELRRGCEAGLLFECRLVADKRYGAEMTCLYARYRCSDVSWKYRVGHDVNEERARYLLELGCQAAMFDACLSLVTAYRDGEWSEPVPGRGKALTRFMCQLWPTEMKCTWGEALIFMPRRP